MGYLALAETASNENQATPTWSLDTSKLEPGYHAYYCFQHRWMRGAFYVE
jgi:plastocyanin